MGQSLSASALTQEQLVVWWPKTSGENPASGRWCLPLCELSRLISHPAVWYPRVYESIRCRYLPWATDAYHCMFYLVMCSAGQSLTQKICPFVNSKPAASSDMPVQPTPPICPFSRLRQYARSAYCANMHITGIFKLGSTIIKLL